MGLKFEAQNLRVTVELKQLLRSAAARERRTLSNMVEVLVREYCDRHALHAAGDSTRSKRAPWVS